MVPEPVLVSWSSGKDSAWALHTLRRQPDRYDVRGVFTTVTDAESRVSIHKTPTWLLREQSDRLRLPLYEIPIPDPCSMSEYEDSMTRFLDTMRSVPDHRRAFSLAFGDLFLDDIRKYREEKLAGTGFTPRFPLWGLDTGALAEEMFSSGVKALVAAVNPAALSPRFAGRWFDAEFLADLPDDVDPLGENGEFHTCVLDGPMFRSPIEARPGGLVEVRIPSDQDPDPHPTYAYIDLLPLS